MSRALHILETVGRATHGLSVKQIARRCELGLSTAYHLVRTLTYEGYLIRRADGSYVPGLEVADRFREFSAAFRAPESATIGLRRAVGMTGRSHYLGRFVDGQVTITGVSEGPRSPHLEDLIVGFDEAAHATALGKALLSTLDRKHRARYLSTVGMRPYTRCTIVDRDEWEHDLSLMRDRGTYIEQEQFRNSVACVAAVIPGPTEQMPRMVLASTMSSEDYRSNEQAVLNQLLTTARGLAAATAANPNPAPLPL